MSILVRQGLSVLASVLFGMAETPFSQSCPEPKASDFKKEMLIPGSSLDEPLEMAISKAGLVFVAQRFGDILLYNPITQQSSIVASLDTYANTGTGTVGGVMGVAVSGEFPNLDSWVYVYYAPKSKFNGIANHSSGKLINQLSRFKFLAGKLDLKSEQVLIEIESIWETHNAGSLKFGKNGDLYLSVGDNRNPACSDQYSPMDERPGQEWCDGQATTANTNDLRGKILRIHPEPELVAGKYYSIPKGNLKEVYASLWNPSELSKVRPEIYTMGHRNPYRIFPDPVSGKLFIAEFGPAAAKASDRGPSGADQLKITDQAAFLGYPYFLKDNRPYCHWDYAQSKCGIIQNQTSPFYDPAKPINTSPNNTGVTLLPPAKPAALWEHDGDDPDPIEGLATCGFGAGPIYHFDETLNSKIKLPPEFNDKWLFFAIFSANWQPRLAVVPAIFTTIKTAALPLWGNLNFGPGLLDMEYGPGDGALYVVDYGSAMYNKNGDAGIYRIIYNGCLPAVSTLPQHNRAKAIPLILGTGMNKTIFVPAGAKSLDVYTMMGEKILNLSLEDKSLKRISEGK